MDTDLPPSWQLIAMMDGFVTTQLIYVAAKLGIADLLRDSPRSGAELAGAIGTESEPLTRVLRGLAAVGVLAEEGDRFALTELGQALGPLRDMALVSGDVYYRAAAGLLDSVRHGDVAFDRVYGEAFFDHLARHPNLETAFQGSMAGRSAQEADDVLAVYDFTGIQTLVDIGGGPASCSPRFWQPTRTCAGSCWIVTPSSPVRRPCCDEPVCRSVSSASPVTSSWRCPPAPTRTCCPASCTTGPTSMPDGSSAPVTGRYPATVASSSLTPSCPTTATDGPFAIAMDLHMLLLFGARERTETQFHTLLRQAGFAVRRIIPTASPAGLSVIEATPDRASE